MAEVSGLLVVLLALALTWATTGAWADGAEEHEDNTAWYDVSGLGLEGQGWTDTAAPYDRLPARAEGVVRDPVWNLSRNSAGLCVRFMTDAPSIKGRWTLRSADLEMNHMPATGVSGLDLYVNDGEQWRWIGVGRPDAQTNEADLAAGIPPGQHEFLLYLPLYNGVTSVEIGVPKESAVGSARPYPEGKDKPICFYGTSITQGGCAARPGMAYPAILGRRLGRPTINLGFSGNGRMEPEMADLLAELDPAAFVIDAAPNLQPDDVAERTDPVVATIRAARPETPIVLVENIRYQAGAFLPPKRDAYEAKNKELRAAYERLLAAGFKHLFYVPCDDLLGHDGEATVDGTHPTDVGFLRLADALEPTLRRVLGE